MESNVLIHFMPFPLPKSVGRRSFRLPILLPHPVPEIDMSPWRLEILSTCTGALMGLLVSVTFGNLTLVPWRGEKWLCGEVVHRRLGIRMLPWCTVNRFTSLEVSRFLDTFGKKIFYSRVQMTHRHSPHFYPWNSFTYNISTSVRIRWFLQVRLARI